MRDIYNLLNASTSPSKKKPDQEKEIDMSVIVETEEDNIITIEVDNNPKLFEMTSFEENEFFKCK